MPRYAMEQAEFVFESALSIVAFVRVFFRSHGDTPFGNRSRY
ncbi:MAG TPA: hypothetical protein PKJ41_01065 [Bryobacteraceae bacterium]|nr:hypothetical protein [Bryobacteraceae bacterium]HPT25249.1 hypothetical protein [Bryobacteraceae bacterium]